MGKTNRCQSKRKHHCDDKRKFSFAAIGDTGYSFKMEEELSLLIRNVLNREDLKFVVHIGDMQNDPRGLATIPESSIAVTEAQWIPKRDRLWRLNKPFILTPGDNDWADTVQPPINNPNPLGTLQAVRNVFYSDTNVPFKFNVVSQPEEFPQYSAYVENRRWRLCDIVFATVHTIAGREQNGTTNPNQGVRDESIVRIQADIAWLNRAFDVAERKNAKGLVIFSQAVIEWSNPLPGFVEIVNAVTARVKQNPDLKVLYICGDNHQFNVQKPMRGEPVSGIVGAPVFRQYENFTAIEVPGAPRSAIGSVGMTTIAGGTGRVRINVDLDSKDIFNMSLDTHTQIVN